MADTTQKRNPIKVMLIVNIIILLFIVVLLLVWNNRIVIEDEQGQVLVGSSGKFVKEPEE